MSGRLRIGEEHRDAGLDRERCVSGHLLAAIPGQRPCQLGGECRHRVRQRVLHRDRAIASQGGTILGCLLVPVSLLAWEVDEHREPGHAVDDGADRGTLQPDQQIAFPMAGNSAVLSFRRAFADQGSGSDVRPRLTT